MGVLMLLMPLVKKFLQKMKVLQLNLLKKKMLKVNCQKNDTSDHKAVMSEEEEIASFGEEEELVEIEGKLPKDDTSDHKAVFAEEEVADFGEEEEEELVEVEDDVEEEE